MDLFIIDGKKITNKESLYNQLELDLKIQGEYGRNLDGLWDYLSGTKANVIIKDPENIEKSLGNYGRSLIKLFLDLEPMGYGVYIWRDSGDFYRDLRERFMDIAVIFDLLEDGIDIQYTSLHGEEAIGVTELKDYPLLRSKEVLVQANFKGSLGQAYTSRSRDYVGSLRGVFKLDLDDLEDRSIFIASLNAIMSNLNLTDRTIHCKSDEIQSCSEKLIKFLENMPNKKTLLVGYQPSMVKTLSSLDEFRVVDLNIDNIGSQLYGVKIEDSILSLQDAISWSDRILVTGSTVVNGTITDFLNLEKEVYFYGTSIAGSAFLMDLNRICYEAK